MTIRQHILWALDDPTINVIAESPEDFGVILSALKTIKTRLEEETKVWHERAFNALESGQHIPGWELGTGRTTWTEENRTLTRQEFENRFGDGAVDEFLAPRLSLGLPALKEAVRAAKPQLSKKDADKLAMEIAELSFSAKTGKAPLKEVKG